MLLHDALQDLGGNRAEDGRYYGFTVGKVTNVGDPNGLGRIKARYAAQSETEESDWLLPLWPGSLECIPRKDDMVVIGFIDGDPHRGFYAWHPTSNTKNRPSEYAVLGTTGWGMINYLVDQFNQLRTDFNTFAGVYSGHTHTVSGGATGTPSATQASTSASSANKGQAADSSTISNVSSASKVLSGNVKVGK